MGPTKGWQARIYLPLAGPQVYLSHSILSRFIGTPEFIRLWRAWSDQE